MASTSWDDVISDAIHIIFDVNASNIHIMADRVQYTHETMEWRQTTYQWNHSTLSAELSEIHFKRGRLISTIEALGFQPRQEASLSAMVNEVAKSSEIEGESLNVKEVRSSIARRLGLEYAGLPAPSRNVEGVVEVMLEATQNYKKPLTKERIISWHAAMFPTGYSGLCKIKIGDWRDDADGPMQVVSGPIGRERVHYQAPSADRLNGEMTRFLRWYEDEPIDLVIKSALSHLWFVTIHPLDDGNGRIGRVIADMTLARADQTANRYYSISEQILEARKEYYDILERTQKSLSMDATEWLVWFLSRLSQAMGKAEQALSTVHAKQRFWEKHSDGGFNTRQIKVVNLLLEGNFIGHLQTKKYASLTKCSLPTAFRDLDELVQRGMLKVEGGGRSTRYELIQS